MINCRFCKHNEYVKNGFIAGKQRYKCRNCKRSFRLDDKRIKHDINVKLRVIKWYLDGAGIRSIERNEGVSSPLIIKWIRNLSNILSDKLKSMEIIAKEKIVIMEMRTILCMFMEE